PAQYRRRLIFLRAAAGGPHRSGGRRGGYMHGGALLHLAPPPPAKREGPSPPGPRLGGIDGGVLSDIEAQALGRRPQGAPSACASPLRGWRLLKRRSGPGQNGTACGTSGTSEMSRFMDRKCAVVRRAVAQGCSFLNKSIALRFSAFERPRGA